MTRADAIAAVQEVLDMGHDNDCPCVYQSREPTDGREPPQCSCDHDMLHDALEPVLNYLRQGIDSGSA